MMDDDSQALWVKAFIRTLSMLVVDTPMCCSMIVAEV